MGTTTRSAPFWLVLVVSLMAGCTDARPLGDKAGAPPEPLILQMAITANDYEAPAAIAYFVDRVGALSRGGIQVHIVGHWGNWAPDAEAQVVRAVSAGEVDLGGADSGAFDRSGLTSLRALSAPLLIDSYALVRRVLESEVPRQMLRDLGPVGVTGLGISFSSFALPLSARRPLLAPGDWQGVAVGTTASITHEAVIRALGATPVVAIGPFRAAALDAGQMHALAFSVDGYANEFPTGTQSELPYVAANVKLWPQFDVLIADPDALASLTDQQKGWLRQAADEAVTFSGERVSKDSSYLRGACDMGVRFSNATPADLEAMRRTFAGVYRTMGLDLGTSAFIQRIADMKRTMPRAEPADIPSDCKWSRG